MELRSIRQHPVPSFYAAASVPAGEGVISFLLALPLFIWLLVRYISLDFWYDEIISLSFYSLAPLKQTVSWYPDPNNHIFFNLLNNLYFRLTGVSDLNALLSRPHAIRLLMLLYAAVTFFYLHRLCRRHINRAVAHLAVIVLATSVPFFNFAVQVRGYILSMMLLVMLLYYLWGFERKDSMGNAFMVVATTALALYTIPLNLYFVMAAFAFYLAAGMVATRNAVLKNAGAGNRPSLLQKSLPEYNRYLVVLLLIGIGVLLAFLFYSPVIYLVVANKYVQSQELFNFQTLTAVMPRTFLYFLSGRALLIPFIAIGFTALVFFAVRGQAIAFVRQLACCLCLLLLPFVFSFVRGDLPYHRVFVNLAPVFAVIVALLLYYCFLFFQRYRNRLSPAILILLTAVYCQATFAGEIRSIEKALFQNIEQGRKSQDIYYNYYQAHYQPNRIVQQFVSRHHQPQIPVYVGLGSDREAVSAYLEYHDIYWRSLALHKDKLFAFDDTIHIIAANPVAGIKTIQALYPGSECEILNEAPDFHNILLCRSGPAT